MFRKIFGFCRGLNIAITYDEIFEKQLIEVLKDADIIVRRTIRNNYNIDYRDVVKPFAVNKNMLNQNGQNLKELILECAEKYQGLNTRRKNRSKNIESDLKQNFYKLGFTRGVDDNIDNIVKALYYLMRVTSRKTQDEAKLNKLKSPKNTDLGMRTKRHISKIPPDDGNLNLKSEGITLEIPGLQYIGDSSFKSSPALSSCGSGIQLSQLPNNNTSFTHNHQGILTTPPLQLLGSRNGHAETPRTDPIVREKEAAIKIQALYRGFKVRNPNGDNQSISSNGDATSSEEQNLEGFRSGLGMSIEVLSSRY